MVYSRTNRGRLWVRCLWTESRTEDSYRVVFVAWGRVYKLECTFILDIFTQKSVFNKFFEIKIHCSLAYLLPNRHRQGQRTFPCSASFDRNYPAVQRPPRSQGRPHEPRNPGQVRVLTSLLGAFPYFHLVPIRGAASRPYRVRMTDGELGARSCPTPSPLLSHPPSSAPNRHNRCGQTHHAAGHWDGRGLW